MGETDHWDHLLNVTRRVTADYADAVFIGGIAVWVYANALGEGFKEASHDADMYLSLTGKAALRDRYEVRRNPNLGKDSALIEGEDVDIYVEHQHPLGIPYDAVAAHAIESEGVRVAALEHLLILKLDAAQDRIGTGKGEKDVRDLARIVALLDEPRSALLKPYMNEQRKSAMDRIAGRPDLAQILGLNPHEGSRFRAKLNRNLEAIVVAAV